jgi:hypothetical protein
MAQVLYKLIVFFENLYKLIMVESIMLKLITVKYTPLTILSIKPPATQNKVNSKEGQTRHSMLKLTFPTKTTYVPLPMQHLSTWLACPNSQG